MLKFKFCSDPIDLLITKARSIMGQLYNGLAREVLVICVINTTSVTRLL